MSLIEKIQSKTQQVLQKQQTSDSIFQIGRDKYQYFVLYIHNKTVCYTKEQEDAEAIIEQIQDVVNWNKYKSFQDFFQKSLIKDDDGNNKKGDNGKPLKTYEYNKVASVLNKYAVPRFFNGNYIKTLTSDNTVEYYLDDELVEGEHYEIGISIRENRKSVYIDLVFADYTFDGFSTKDKAKLFLQTIEDFMPLKSSDFKALINQNDQILRYLDKLHDSIEMSDEIVEIDSELKEDFRFLALGGSDDAENKFQVYKEAMDKLHSMVGLKSVKQQVDHLLKMIKAERKMKEEGSRIEKTPMHSLFVGNAGTGKTEVARLIGDILWSLGLSEERKLIEVSKEDLTSKNIGETEEIVSNKINQAIGGVLFFDEAYMLTGGAGNDDTGQTILEIIMRAMENHRDNLVVIFAGYEKEMDELLDMNQGLRSRFADKYYFEDFTPPELREIANGMLQKQGFDVSDVQQEIYDVFKRKTENGKMQGNARDVRKMVDKIVQYHKVRIVDQNGSTKNIHPDDVKKLIEKQQFVSEEGLKEIREEAKKQLNNLIGLENLKKEIEKWSKFIKTTQKRYERGLSDSKPNFHMTFEGNPGTGKTTVARNIGQILKGNGLISKGHFKEASRSDLVAEYVGQTAPKVKQLIQDSIGGVLVIDEAYSLVNSENDTFGKEAVDTLIAEMENNRDDLVVILAGYTKEINDLLETNPGFKSRIANRFVFEDYDANELFELFKLQIKSNNFELTDEASEKAETIIFKAKENDEVDGNGRWIRNFIEKIQMEQSVRVADLEEDEELNTITAEDVQEGFDNL